MHVLCFQLDWVNVTVEYDDFVQYIHVHTYLVRIYTCEHMYTYVLCHVDQHAVHTVNREGE